MQKDKILITGATGFVGSAVLNTLSKGYYSLVAPVRKLPNVQFTNAVLPLVDDITTLTGKLSWLEGCKIAIHIAAKAHVQGVALSEFKRVNTEATLNLARLCAVAGVKRFIFLSSIGVNGISNSTPFFASDTPAPVEDYAISKFEAELGLKKIAAETGMEVVIIRPPLVYGPDAPGNFGKLARLANKNLPLPLGAIHNKRSLVGLDNLVDLIVTCIDHPHAANQTFLVSDDQDVSTTQLLQLMIRAAGKKPKLLPIPMSWLALAGKLTAKQAVIERICSNLQVDIAHTKQTLGWKPPLSVEEGIARCF